MKIFLSYSRKDEKEAVSLQKALGELGYSVWRDNEIRVGTEWWPKILKNIRNHDFFIFVLSPESLDSKACQLEFNYANELNKPILPIMIEEVSPKKLPSSLLKIQHIRYVEKNPKTIIELSEALRSIPLPRIMPNPLPPEPKAPTTHLGDIRRYIKSKDVISFRVQEHILLKLEKELNNLKNKRDAIEILIDLRQHQDLRLIIANEIDKALKKLERNPNWRLRILFGILCGISYVAIFLYSNIFRLLSDFFSQASDMQNYIKTPLITIILMITGMSIILIFGRKKILTHVMLTGIIMACFLILILNPELLSQLENISGSIYEKSLDSFG